MYANVVTLRYKSENDLDRAREKMETLAGQLPDLPGFRAFALVRTGPQETVHVVHFESAENAATARDRMLPQLREAAGGHIEGEPNVRHGPILVTKTAQQTATAR